MMGTETEAFLAEVLPAQLAAEKAIHEGDVERRIALWSHADPVTLYGAVLTGSGWTELEPMFRTVASWFSGSQEYEFEIIAAAASGDLAYTVGYEHNKTQVVGDQGPRVYTLRVTHVYRREGGQWRIVHRHADYPPVPETHALPREGGTTDKAPALDAMARSTK